jgi:hypothetical protein
MKTVADQFSETIEGGMCGTRRSRPLRPVRRRTSQKSLRSGPKAVGLAICTSSTGCSIVKGRAYQCSPLRRRSLRPNSAPDIFGKPNPRSCSRRAVTVQIVATALFLLCVGPSFAQVGTAMPPLGVASSLGTDPSAPVGTNALAPSVSTPVNPVPNGVTGTIAVPGTSSGAGPCSTLATSPIGTFGSPATYDGGGMAMATGTTTLATAATTGGVAPSGTSTSSEISASTAIAPTSGETTSSGMVETSGLTGMCGSGSSSIASSSSPTSTSATSPSGSARAGVPLGSYEIGNFGVSSPTAAPTTSVSPITGSVGSPAPSKPTMPAVSLSATSTIP